MNTQSNSKLTKEQNQERKEMKAVAIENCGAFVFSFPDQGVTVVVQRTGEDRGVFAVSLESENERKFRRKVGEFHALNRFHDGTTLPVALATTESFNLDEDESSADVEAVHLHDVAQAIAFAIG